MDKSVIKDTAAAAAEIKIALASAREAKNQFRDGVTTIRSYIKTLKLEKASVLALCVSEDVAQERAAEWIDHIARHYGFKAVRPEHFAQRDYQHQPGISIPGILVECLDVVMKETLKKKISEFYRDVPNITGEERAAQLAAIDRKILDAEMAEESLIRAAWYAGFTVQRRADAHPWAVMAKDSALP